MLYQKEHSGIVIKQFKMTFFARVQFDHNSKLPLVTTYPEITAYQKLASKARCRSGILRCAKSVLGKKKKWTSAFVVHWSTVMLTSCGLGFSASRLSLLKSKALEIIGISRDEAEAVLLSHRRQVAGFFYFTASPLVSIPQLF